MDNPTTLLVAIMFVTILAMAIGNVLMACADIAGGLRHPVPEGIQLSWICLMLLASLSLFWETTALLEIEQWLFVEFLYVISGPMIMLFAVSIITSPTQAELSIESHSHYLELSGRFFMMLALHELWILGIDYRYASLDVVSLINGLMMLLFVVLAFSDNLRVHVAGALMIWIGYIVSVALRTIEAIAVQ